MSDALAAYRDFQARGGVADLSARVKLSLTGADTVRYLNGQVTSNVQTLAVGQTQPANRFGRPGWDHWTHADVVAEAWPKITARYVALDEPLLETLRLEAGIPRWGRELDENTLPPEAGLDRTHIDYHKGCYIGQEVISRLKSVEHVNRQLMGFVGKNTAPLTLGSAVFAASEPEKQIGHLTSASWSFALDKPVALG